MFRGKRPVYRASEGIGVVLHQPEKAGELVSAAIGAGATGVSGPSFFVGDTEAAFANALAAAFDKAKLRANALAVRAGGALGPALTIDEGEGPELTPQFESAAPKSVSDCVTSSPASPGSAPVAIKRTARCATPATDEARHVDGDRNGPRRLRPAIGREAGPAVAADRGQAKERPAALNPRGSSAAEIRQQEQHQPDNDADDPQGVVDKYRQDDPDDYE